ncbi:hypothetical protein CAEBREN_30519 [Caenorhabditis brenneri]|uniref:ShKT domain-containing protein n=1 Tax=Caenorhabditis brenneri TaxID=135651 RepID=G0PGU6_CAEBE|nr:hypothetical protein CAEBREN_30519 [Caenorhabditis brenneri]
MYGGYGPYGGGYGMGYGMYGGYGMPFGGSPFMGGYGPSEIVPEALLPPNPPPLPLPLPPSPIDPTNPTNPSNPPSPESQKDCRGLPSMRARSLCRYGNPMMPGMMGGYGGATGCMDLNPQCSVWASTGGFLVLGDLKICKFPGQCSTNAAVMRQTCALSCGTCASGLSGLGGLGTSSIYNPFGTSGLDQYPLSQFIGRSIYETGLLNRAPNPSGASKNLVIFTKAKSVESDMLPVR